LKPAKKIGGRLQALPHAGDHQPHFADVEGGVQVAREDGQMKLLSVVATGNLPEQQKVALADGLGELLHGAAEIARLLAADVLQSVDA
jgi:hypothetical protein